MTINAGITTKSEPVPFTVASALLRELGERLVGKPHIALAELVKNSYDADANDVVIRFTDDCIQIIDNGHGMNEDEFRRFWMRIGSSHKHDLRVSRSFGRPLTGSKGVGRLAVQFLARFIQLRSVSELSPQIEITAKVDWDEAIASDDLVKATAKLSRGTPTESFANESMQGTEITLRGLNQQWNAENFQDLAREIWSLQPPFRSNLTTETDRKRGFSIKLETPEADYTSAFERLMVSTLNDWEARIVGKLHEGSTTSVKSKAPTLDLTVEFPDRAIYKESFQDEEFQKNAESVGALEFEIRVFRLSNKLKQGIKVEEARKYFSNYGGVHVYDAGFHLPYYGPDTDWLGIERDHARRQSQSELLPEEMKKSVARGLNFLPTQRRLFGVVKIDTNSEYQRAIQRAINAAKQKQKRALTQFEVNKLAREVEKTVPYLKLQVTRDRLVNNAAAEALSRLVRASLDYYSIIVQKRNQEVRAKQRKMPTAAEEIEQLGDAIASVKSALPATAYMELQRQFVAVKKATTYETREVDERFGMLGALATAGISALAYDHELNRQINQLDNLAKQLDRITIAEQTELQQVLQIAQRLHEWVQRARETRKLYSHLVTEESRESRQRFKAIPLLREVENQMQFFLRGIPLHYSGFDDELRLPEGSFAEWSSLFQNVLSNAFNAMLDAEQREIGVFARRNGPRVMIRLEDTGCGVDLEESEHLFEPFERKLEISPERRGLGLGGTGLGLTIVRMLTERLHCRVRFVTPSEGFNTALELSWREHE
ncbi:MAG: sensor histidine kinase [Blastocatellia bacterium]|nr:sensor histidine kinase [Blastocatellia bacterium]